MTYVEFGSKCRLEKHDPDVELHPLQVLEDEYCRISFNSAGVVTSDQKNRFGTSATNEIWRDTDKISAFAKEILENCAFFAPSRGIWPGCHGFCIRQWAP
jgi:hypothetical protein